MSQEEFQKRFYRTLKSLEEEFYPNEAQLKSLMEKDPDEALLVIYKVLVNMYLESGEVLNTLHLPRLD